MCPLDDIAAYVDGEMSAKAAEKLEMHIAACPACARSLMEQRQFLAALSASLNSGSSIDLPSNFAKRIVTNAESSVSGVRRPYELFTAICICLALFLFVLFAFGDQAIALVSAASSVGEKVLVVGSFVLRQGANAILAVAIVSRSLAAYVGLTVFLVAAAGVVSAALAYISSRRFTMRRHNA